MRSAFAQLEFSSRKTSLCPHFIPLIALKSRIPSVFMHARCGHFKLILYGTHEAILHSNHAHL